MAELLMTSDEITTFLKEVFPQSFGEDNVAFSIDAIQPNEALLGLTAGEEHLRPGGTVSGPAMMELADYAMYVLVLAHIGPVELAVTTNFSINFLRKPLPGRLLAKARMLKLGRSLAVGDIFLSSEAEPLKAVAHASVTYSIPPRV